MDSVQQQLKELADRQSRLQEENKSLVQVAVQVSQLRKDVEVLVSSLDAKEHTIASLQKEVCPKSLHSVHA